MTRLGIHTEPRNVYATCRFRAGPGRFEEAAEAWAFELTYYFLRGVGEAPVVQYFPEGPETGVYVCTGLMQTTHPGDRDESVFDAPPAPAWDLDRCSDPGRRQYLRDLYERRDPASRFDGRALPEGYEPQKRDPWEQLAQSAAAQLDDPSADVRAHAAGPPPGGPPTGEGTPPCSERS